MSIKIENNYYFHRTDDGIGAWYSSQFVTSSLLGTLNPSYPGTYYDFAFKASKSGVSFRDNNNSSNSLAPKTDTLACNTKSVKINYIWFNDTLGLNKYEWTWADKKSNEQFPEITFDNRGKFDIGLKITFPDFKIARFTQIVFIPECNSNFNNLDSVNTINLNELSLFPNPSSSFIKLQVKENSIYQYIIFDSYGNLLKQSIFSGNSCEIDCKEFSAGLYFIVVSNNISNYSLKFIKQ